MGVPLIIFFKKLGVPPNHQIFRRRPFGARKKNCSVAKVRKLQKTAVLEVALGGGGFWVNLPPTFLKLQSTKSTLETPQSTMIWMEKKHIRKCYKCFFCSLLWWSSFLKKQRAEKRKKDRFSYVLSRWRLFSIFYPAVMFFFLKQWARKQRVFHFENVPKNPKFEIMHRCCSANCDYSKIIPYSMAFYIFRIKRGTHGS